MSAFETAFETTTCSRCCGSGKYSFNLIHGSRCYGCGGSGKVLTKRGKAAQKWFRDAISRPAREVPVGWLVWWPDVSAMGKSKWVTVADSSEPHQIGTSGNGEPLMVVDFITMSGSKCGVSPDTLVRAVESIAQRDAVLQQAIAYQETLNPNTGKPAKRTTGAAA